MGPWFEKLKMAKPKVTRVMKFSKGQMLKLVSDAQTGGVSDRLANVIGLVPKLGVKGLSCPVPLQSKGGCPQQPCSFPHSFF